jgi:hypothetical protein
MWPPQIQKTLLVEWTPTLLSMVRAAGLEIDFRDLA